MDDTSEVAREAQLKYPFIHYHRNKENVGFDRNFEIAVKLSQSRFSWIIGDDDRINPGTIESILDILEKSNPQLVLLNGGSVDHSAGRVQDEFPAVYTRATDLLRDLGWHSTWISGLILSRPLIAEMQFEPYIGSYFVHIGSIYTALARHEVINANWVSTSCFHPSATASFSVASRVFEVFAEKWTSVVMSLPDSYPTKVKQHCIKSHSIHVGIFSAKGLLNLRAQGVISRALVRDYAPSLAIASQTNLHVAAFIASIPIWLLRGPRRVFVWLRLRVRALLSAIVRRTAPSA